LDSTDTSKEEALSMNAAPGVQTQHPCRRAYIGIDNGFTGAIACLLPDNRALCRPVEYIDLGTRKRLEIQANISILHEMMEAAGSTTEDVLVIYEQGQIAPKFGARNNFIAGQTDEFWRVVLTLEKIPFMVVNPKVWQSHVFQGVRGEKSKAKASLVRRQRFPKLDCSDYNAQQVEGINDALLIALWGRETNR
jgi:hypothetical protein